MSVTWKKAQEVFVYLRDNTILHIAEGECGRREVMARVRPGGVLDISYKDDVKSKDGKVLITKDVWHTINAEFEVIWSESAGSP